MTNLKKDIEKIINTPVLSRYNFLDEAEKARDKSTKQLLTLFADGADKQEFELLTRLLKLADGGNDLRSLIEGQLQSERFKKKFIQKGVG